MLAFHPLSVGKNIRVEVVFFQTKVLYFDSLKDFFKIEKTHTVNESKQGPF